ncbi:hypothetical protein LY78DRAFT_391287 [Colletotrichum sublineola]|nr:hypothetical protein LY78DRAFT_391287 [Colletotrichum sublineola]
MRTDYQLPTSDSLAPSQCLVYKELWQSRCSLVSDNATLVLPPQLPSVCFLHSHFVQDHRHGATPHPLACFLVFITATVQSASAQHCSGRHLVDHDVRLFIHLVWSPFHYLSLSPDSIRSYVSGVCVCVCPSRSAVHKTGLRASQRTIAPSACSQHSLTRSSGTASMYLSRARPPLAFFSPMLSRVGEEPSMPVASLGRNIGLPSCLAFQARNFDFSTRSELDHDWPIDNQPQVLVYPTRIEPGQRPFSVLYLYNSAWPCCVRQVGGSSTESFL